MSDADQRQGRQPIMDVVNKMSPVHSVPGHVEKVEYAGHWWINGVYWSDIGTVWWWGGEWYGSLHGYYDADGNMHEPGERVGPYAAPEAVMDEMARLTDKEQDDG